MDKDQYGPWAIVTGASRGLGEGFVRALAERGFNVILVARNKIALTTLSSDIEDQFAIDTKVIAVDLANENAVADIIAQTEGLEIGLLINNAAMVMGGSLLKHQFDDEKKMLGVNIVSPIELTHQIANRMKQRGRGGIIFVSSIAGYNAMPYMASYIATKSFLISFGEALYHELKPHDVDVQVLSPGLTDTNPNNDHEPVVGFRSLNSSSASSKMSVVAVVNESLNNLGRKETVIPGLANKFMAFVMRHLLTRKRGAKLMSKMGRNAISDDMI